MNLDQITPVLITYNEESNIARTLSSLSWARQIVVVDSGSTDRTQELLLADERVQMYERAFDDMATQWNFALSKAHTDWVLSCDADYFVTSALQTEIAALPDSPPFDSYSIPFRYCINGKPLSASILPPRCALFRRSCATYINDGHTQLLSPEGESGALSAPLWHDDRKPFSRWLQNQKKYMRLEAKKLRDQPFRSLSLQDKLRRLILPAPFLVFGYCLVLRGGILDGWPGFVYATQRAIAEFMLSMELLTRAGGR